MEKIIETLEVGGLVVENYWDSDDELNVDINCYSVYLSREQAAKLRDHLTTMLAIEKGN